LSLPSSVTKYAAAQIVAELWVQALDQFSHLEIKSSVGTRILTMLNKKSRKRQRIALQFAEVLLECMSKTAE